MAVPMQGPGRVGEVKMPLNTGKPFCLLPLNSPRMGAAATSDPPSRDRGAGRHHVASSKSSSMIRI